MGSEPDEDDEPAGKHPQVPEMIKESLYLRNLLTLLAR